MKVTSSKNGSACTLTVEGKIDTMTAPELEEAVKSNLPKCEKMIFDFTNANYITSAGLRVLVYAQRELIKRLYRYGNVQGTENQIILRYIKQGFPVIGNPYLFSKDLTLLDN